VINRRPMLLSAMEPTGTNGVDVQRVRQAIRVAVVESLATYAVKRGLELGYRRATRRELPTARTRDVPFRQVLFWTGVTAAALSAATVIVDQYALRRESPSPLSPTGTHSFSSTTM
jgi:hypothetical protein